MSPAPAGDEADPLWPVGFGAWIKIGVCYQKTSRVLASWLRPLGLTVAQFDALANLYVADHVTQQQLADGLLVTKGNVTGLVNRLSRRGLVERRDDPHDRRARRLVLTAPGRRLAKRALGVQRRLVERMMGPLVHDDVEALRVLLDRVVAQVEQVAAGDGAVDGAAGKTAGKAAGKIGRR